jgi:hypothetical protein
MNEGYTLSLALFDFVPNMAFLVGAYFLVRLVLMERGTRCGRMMMAGTLLVFLGGFFKATWKLLYATGTADIQWMSQIQFVLLAPGFLAMLVAIILTARQQRESGKLPLLAIAPWKIPLLAVMTICSIGAQGVLTYIAFRRRVKVAGFLFALAVLCTFGMGGLASGEQTVAKQWIEESINAVGQISFAIGSFLLYRDFRNRHNAPC